MTKPLAGTTVLRREATWHDDREEEAQERLEACISAFACFEAACSFYSAAGEVSGAYLILRNCSLSCVSALTCDSVLASLPVRCLPAAVEEVAQGLCDL